MYFVIKRQIKKLISPFKSSWGHIVNCIYVVILEFIYLLSFVSMFFKLWVFKGLTVFIWNLYASNPQGLWNIPLVHDFLIVQLCYVYFIFYLIMPRDFYCLEYFLSYDELSYYFKYFALYLYSFWIDIFFQIHPYRIFWPSDSLFYQKIINYSFVN